METSVPFVTSILNSGSATPTRFMRSSTCSWGIGVGVFPVPMKPVTFGVLTVDTIEQAIERAGTKAGNKGAEAALSAIEVVSLFKSMES